jgi:hypothetical protein
VAKETDRKGKTGPPLAWRVVGTLAWFGILGRGLTLPELSRLLLKRSAQTVKLEQSLEKLSGVVVKRDGRFRLAKTEVGDSPPESARWFRYKWWRAGLGASLLSWVPYVRMVAVANTLADRTATKDSDIDFFIVAESGRLYTVRTFSVLMMQLAGLRRHGKKISNRICLTFYVTTDHLNLADVAFAPYDIYLAYWISELTPLLEKPSVYKDFLKANRWVEAYVPAYSSGKHSPRKPSIVAKGMELLLRGVGGVWLEHRLAAYWQRRIDVGPRPGEPDVRIVASQTMLKFHEKERRREYRERWEALMKKLGYNPKLIK